MSVNLKEIHIADYEYDLPKDRIAFFPKRERDQSALLYDNGKQTSAHKFSAIGNLIPRESLLVFNDTKVIQARLLFQKKTGARIEIFCLDPADTYEDYQIAFESKSEVYWNCLIGNAKRWKDDALQKKLEVKGKGLILKAEKIRQNSDSWLIRFSWEPGQVSFAELLEVVGKVPLPPYINREAIKSDSERYQTIYARYNGSVAAPTAGLHFTDSVIQSLKDRNVEFAYSTLHVGAGTFKPVSSESIAEHEMHTENIIISRALIENILKKRANAIIAVGTTSTRCLESIYWLGVKILNTHYKGGDFYIGQTDAYDIKVAEEIDTETSLKAVLDYMQKNKLESLNGWTRMMIVPGYKYRIVNALITNFHQPRSTLLLLVAALIGERWKIAYNYALKKDFRFLSYGDSCFFIPRNFEL